VAELKEAYPEAEVQLWAEAEMRLGLKPVCQEGVGSQKQKAHCENQKTLRVALCLRLCASHYWRGPLADPTEGQSVEILSMAL